MSDLRTAVLFPGQGSQTPEMREEVAAIRPDLLEHASEVVGHDPFARVDEGTRFVQPAIFCASLAGWERLRVDTEPAMLAGHSLGEITALVAAGSMPELDGLRLVAARGRLMQEASERSAGGMMAVRGGAADVEPLLAGTGAVIANDNAPKQVVLAGSVQALEAAQERLAGAGIRGKRLPVSGAFHSPLMEPAVAAFAVELERVRFAAPAIPVVSCFSPGAIVDPAQAIASALTRPVRWVDTLHALHHAGIERYVETGPGKVLTGLVRRTLPEPAHA